MDWTDNKFSSLRCQRPIDSINLIPYLCIILKLQLKLQAFLLNIEINIQSVFSLGISQLQYPSVIYPYLV